LSLVRVTVEPPAGAGPDRVTVPVAGLPPVTLGESTVTPRIVGPAGVVAVAVGGTSVGLAVAVAVAGGSSVGLAVAVAVAVAGATVAVAVDGVVAVAVGGAVVDVAVAVEVGITLAVGVGVAPQMPGVRCPVQKASLAAGEVPAAVVPSGQMVPALKVTLPKFASMMLAPVRSAPSKVALP
jgi:hypothetical protein